MVIEPSHKLKGSILAILIINSVWFFQWFLRTFGRVFKRSYFFFYMQFVQANVFTKQKCNPLHYGPLNLVTKPTWTQPNGLNLIVLDSFVCLTQGHPPALNSLEPIYSPVWAIEQRESILGPRVGLIIFMIVLHCFEMKPYLWAWHANFLAYMWQVHA